MRVRRAFLRAFDSCVGAVVEKARRGREDEDEAVGM